MYYTEFIFIYFIGVFDTSTVDHNIFPFHCIENHLYVELIINTQKANNMDIFYTR